MGAFGPVTLDRSWPVVVLLVFGGRGKLSGIMGDAAKGVRAFREGLKGEERGSPAPKRKPRQPAPKPARGRVARTTKAKTAARPAAKPRAKTKA